MLDGFIEDSANANVMNDVSIEMALLSLALRKNQAVVEIINSKIEQADFSDKRNQVIYGAILDMYYAGEGNADRYTVEAYLQAHNLIADAGGSVYIYDVANATSVISNINTYIAQIKEMSDRRKVVGVINTTMKNIHESGNKTNDIVDSTIAALSNFRNEENSTGFEPMNVILSNTIKEMRSDLDNKDGNGRVNTGFRHLDKMLGGLRPGSLNILGARPGMGKSALAVNMATNVAASGKCVAIFSLEMSKTEIGSRILSSGMKHPLRGLMKPGGDSDAIIKEASSAVKKLNPLKIFIDDNAGTNPITMRAKLTQLSSDPETTPNLVIVDYLQLMSMPGYERKSKNDEVSAISRSLKIMAKDLEIPIIALSQMSRRAAKDDNDHTPQLSDLRDSGAIEQDADTVMFVDRPGYYKKAGTSEDDGGEEEKKKNGYSEEVQEAYIYLAKNRHGETKRVDVCWIPSRTLFIEKDPSAPVESESPYTRSVSADSAAADYHYDDDNGVPEPTEAPPEEPTGSSFMDDELNQDYPTGF